MYRRKIEFNGATIFMPRPMYNVAAIHLKGV